METQTTQQRRSRSQDLSTQGTENRIRTGQVISTEGKEVRQTRTHKKQAFKIKLELLTHDGNRNLTGPKSKVETQW